MSREQLLGCNPPSKQGQTRLRQTEHLNGLPASGHLSSVNGGDILGRFNPRYVRVKLGVGTSWNDHAVVQIHVVHLEHVEG
jgi:hypothetical protein